MVAHDHGQVWNHAEPAQSLGVSQPAIRRDLDLLTDGFMIRQPQPWHQNRSKRQVKSPKVCIRDRGLLHQFMPIAERLRAWPAAPARYTRDAAW